MDQALKLKLSDLFLGIFQLLIFELALIVLWGAWMLVFHPCLEAVCG